LIAIATTPLFPVEKQLSLDIMTTSSIDHTKGYDGGDLAGDAWELEQLIAKGVSIEIEAKWWGYTIVMNENAVNILEHCLDWIDEKFKKHFKETKLRRAISLAVQFKKDRLVRAVGNSKDGFVRMVSPWVVPFALVVVRGASSNNDQNLWFTVWDEDTKKWGEDAEFHECMTRSAPALAQHGDSLYCVHRGCNDDDQLWWTKYSTEHGWSDDKKFPNHRTELNPSLVEFQNTLFCFHRGTGDNYKLYYCTFNSGDNTWNPDIKITVGEQPFFSTTGCAVAIFNDGNLHLVYQVHSDYSGDNNKFRHLIFDGKAWRINNNHPEGTTADTPALVAYQNKLLMVYRSDSKDHTLQMWCTTYDGTWSKDLKVPGTYSKVGPGLAVFGDKVYMAHRGASDAALYYSIYYNSQWIIEDTKISNVYTGAPPALASYTDPQCNSDNYEDPKTSKPRLICVHRGYG